MANLNCVKSVGVATRPPADPLYAAEEIYGAIPSDTRKPYDVREVIARVVDGSSSTSSRPATAPRW
ncbi:MAG: carboxyl transferase domain-containing protein [Burkholderiales bacterium]